MKKEIHPKYMKSKVECVCGYNFETRATAPHIKVEICSQCHPFYTGKQKLVDTAGRVDKFKAKMATAEKKKVEKEKKKKKKTSKQNKE